MPSRLIKNLELRDDLSIEEKNAILELPVYEKSFSGGEDIVRIGDEPENSNLLLDGFVCRYRDLENGGRQILALHVPGDFIDLQSLLLKVMDHSLQAVGPCRIAIVPHEKLKRVTANFPHLTRMLWLSPLIDAAIHREWLLGLGRRSARARAAHLICELYTRLSIVGLASNYRFALPLSQRLMAEALGISAVHANRSIQALRNAKLIDWELDRLTIRNWDQLVALAEFDPIYLHLEKVPR